MPLFLPVLCVQKVNGLAVLVHRTVPILPLALHFERSFVHPPTAPDGPLVAV